MSDPAMAAEAADVLDLIEAKWTTQAIGVAAELGIADLVAGSARDVQWLSSATGCEASSLRRLLRALATLRLVREEEGGRYSLTARGSLLRDDAKPSLRAWARWGARQHWGPWGKLLESVRSARSARAMAGEAGGYGHLEEDPAKAVVFNRAMADVTALVAQALLAAFDFGAVRRVADIGGGYGELLRAILEPHPRLVGILFDMPHAIEVARPQWERSALASRCELVMGDFFAGVPRADVLVLKSILHNWDDENASRILEACAQALPRSGRVLLVERVMPDRITGADDERRVARADLNMLVSHSGRERTRGEFASLLGRHGLTLLRAAPLAVGFSLVEAGRGPA